MIYHIRIFTKYSIRYQQYTRILLTILGKEETYSYLSEKWEPYSLPKYCRSPQLSSLHSSAGPPRVLYLRFNLLATIATKRVDRAVGGGCRMARRWGLCHSERHTYGAMKGLLQRRFSRVAVRGAAKVRLRALQAITGRIQGRFEVEEGKFYSAEDADRATSTNYLYQEPDCRVERLPDALASTLPGGG